MKLKKFGNKRAEVKNWSQAIVCDTASTQNHIGCKAEYIIQLSDVYRVKKETPTMIQMFFLCLCPCCGAEITIPFKDIPQDVDIKDKNDWLKKARLDKLQQLFEMAEDQTDYQRIVKACTDEIGLSEEFLQDHDFIK